MAETIDTRVRVTVTPVIEGLNELIRALEVYKQDIPRGLERLVEAQRKFSEALKNASRAEKQALSGIVSQVKRDVNTTLREFERLEKKAKVIQANLSDIAPKLKPEQVKVLEQEFRKIAKTLETASKQFSVGVLQAFKDGGEIKKASLYTKEFSKDLALISREFDQVTRKAREFAKENERIAKQAERLARQQRLYDVRGRELSLIAERMRTYPFQAHELARPAEQLVTSFFMAPREMMKTWWRESGNIAREMGRNHAQVFVASFGQFVRQQFARSFGAWLGAALTTFPIFYGMVNIIGEINREYNALAEVSRYVQSATLGVGGTFEDLRGIMSQITKLAVETGVSFREAGEALWEFRSAGFGAKEAFAGTAVALKLAQLGGIKDVAKATRVVAGIYRLFKDDFREVNNEAERMEEIFGRVVYILNTSQIGVDELLKAFEYFGATAKATGMDLNQLLAIISVLSDERLPGVGRAARQAMNQLAQAIPMVAAKFGIVFDATKPFADQIPKVFEELNKRIQEGALSLADFYTWMKEAGVRGGPAIIALARNWKILQERMEILRDSQKYLGMEFREFFKLITEVRMDHYTKQWEKFKYALLSLTTEAIHPLKTALGELFDTLTPIVQLLTKLNLGAIIGGVTGYIAGGPFGAAALGLLGWGIREMQLTRREALPWIHEPVRELFEKTEFTKIRDVYEEGLIKPIEYLFTGDLRKIEAKRENAARKVRAFVNETLSSVILGLQVPAEQKEKLLEQFLFSDEDVKRFIQEEIPFEDLAYEVQERLYGIAEAAGTSIEALKPLASVFDLLEKSAGSSLDPLGKLVDMLSAAASGKQGFVNAMQTFAANMKTIVGGFEKLSQLTTLQQKLLETPGKEAEKRLKTTKTQISGVVSVIEAPLAQTMRATATINRIIDQMMRVAAGEKGPFASLFKDLEKIEALELFQRTLEREGNSVEKFISKLKELRDTIKDPTLQAALDLFIERLERIGEVDLRELKTDYIRNFVKGIVDDEWKNVFGNETDRLKEKVSELFDIKQKILEIEKETGVYLKDQVSKVERLIDTYGILVKLSKERTRLELENKKLSVEELALKVKGAATRKPYDDERLELQIKRALLAKKEEASRILEEITRTEDPERIRVLQERFRLLEKETILQEQLLRLEYERNQEEKKRQAASFKRQFLFGLERDIAGPFDTIKIKLKEIDIEYLNLLDRLNQMRETIGDDDYFGLLEKLNEWHSEMLRRVADVSYKFEKIWKGAIDNVIDSFADMVMNLRFDLDTFLNIFRRAAAEMLATWIKTVIQMRMADIGGGGGLLGGLFGGIFGGIKKLFGGGKDAFSIANAMTSTWKDLNFSLGTWVFHNGGVVGETNVPTRFVPAMVFSHAPKLHSGLMPDEFPAILQKGEIVLPKGSTVGTTNVFIIHAVDAKSFEDLVRKNPRVFMEIYENAIRKNHGIVNLLREAL